MDNVRYFCEETYQWKNTKTGKQLTSCGIDSILREVVSNGKDSYRVVKNIVSNTQLDAIEISTSDKQIILVSENSLASPLSQIDILYNKFTSFKVFVVRNGLIENQNFLL